MRAALKEAVNGALGALGLRLVSSRWGPVGLTQALRRIKAAGIEPAQIIDIGAAQGEWTRECLEVFPRANYLLVDPLTENRDALVKLQQQNPRVDFWMGALAARGGSAKLSVHGDQSSFLTSDEFHGPAREVAVQRLDSLLQSRQVAGPLLIKADVQGYELEVLKGGPDTLARAELVLLETSVLRLYEGCTLAHEVIEFMASHGFRLLDICTYVQRPLDGRLAQADLLFAANGSQLFVSETWSAR